MVCSVAVKAIRRLSLEDVESAAFEALFQRGVQLRLYFAPFVFLTAISLLAWDPAPWRFWVVVFAVAFAASRLTMEYRYARREGFKRSRLSSLIVVPATLLLLVVGASGGIDSPIFVILPLVTLFMCLFFKPSYGLVFASVSAVWAWALTLVAWNEWVPTLIPLAFGGGPRVPVPAALLFTRAVFLTIGLLWASLIGRVMRGAFQDAIQRALNARDEVLTSHEESTKALTTLVAEIAHELKNPLTSVKGLAALVDREVEGKGKERLTVLRREVDRMQEILESFLNFSRPVVPLDVAPVRVVTVVDQVMALYEGVARERGVEVRLDARTDVVVKADARKLKQVIINLVQNALDVTVDGGVFDVTVGHEGKGAKICVMDRGPGIDDVERVFEPGVTTKKSGNGLGLTIARLLARQHGGEVRLVPREAGGMVAELTLPEAPPT